MCRISAFILCESINNIPTNSPNSNAVVMVSSINAPQTVLRPQFVPGNFSFGMVIGVSGIDLMKPNKIYFKIYNPDGKEVHRAPDLDLPLETIEETILPEEYRGFTLCVDVRNVPMEKNGEYKFEFFVNGDSIGTEPIPVYKRVM